MKTPKKMQNLVRDKGKICTSHTDEYSVFSSKVLHSDCVCASTYILHILPADLGTTKRMNENRKIAIIWLLMCDIKASVLDIGK